jgi:pantetheine-phosphate adenylyltransferase
MIAVYAGSFDPPTLGHVDIIHQARRLFEEVHVLVASNASKSGRLIPPERAAALITASTYAPAEVCPPGRYVADVVASRWHDHACLIRGLRDASDMGPEIAIRRANEIIARELPTVYFLASPGVAHVSSSAVRALVGLAGWQDVVRRYVPECVLLAIEEEV